MVLPSGEHIGNISLLPSVTRRNPVPSASLRQMFTERVFNIPRAKTRWPSLQPLGSIAADSFSEAISHLSSPFGLRTRMDEPCAVRRLPSLAHATSGTGSPELICLASE